ncbi:MAG: 16S rRNA (guanine(527)-N(7))-methyltransferase RsmG [Pseudomonadota bacterium]
MTPDTLSELSGVDVSRETFSRLDAFSEDFDAWANRINLVAPSTREEFWRRHVIDSLQLIAIRRDAKVWADIGSGGGFPGLIIAIALADDRDSRVTLVESNRKKCAFLQMAKAKYAPRTNVVPARIEEAIPKIDAPEIVTARALADLETLLSMTRSWLEKSTAGLFMKGREYVGEIEKSRTHWQFDLVTYESRTAADSAILEVSKLAPLRS